MSSIFSFLVLFLILILLVTSSVESTEANFLYSVKDLTLCCPSNSILVNDNCEIQDVSPGIVIDDPVQQQDAYLVPDLPTDAVNASEERSPFDLSRIVGNIDIPDCHKSFNVFVSVEKATSMLLPNGNVRYNGDLYSPQEYCISRTQMEEGKNIRFRFCNITCGVTRACFRKCCKWNEIVQVEVDSPVITDEKTSPTPICVKNEGVLESDLWEPQIYLNPLKKANSDVYELSKIHFQAQGFPGCKYTILQNDASVWFRILEEGDVKIGLQLTLRPVWLSVSSHHYCIDAFKTNADNASSSSSEILFYCDVDNFDVYIAQRILYGCLYLISATILLSVLIINYLLWSTHKLSGWTIVSLFTAMFFRYLVSGLDILVNANGLNITYSKYCFIRGLVIQFFFLSYASSWFVVNYDMFRTFRNLYQQMELWTNRSRLYVYLLFTWVSPLIIVVGGTAIYFIANDLPHDSVRFHEFAFMSCYSPIVKPAMIYTIIIVILNVIFFVSTTILICNHRRSVRMATFNQTFAYGDTFKVFLKLSILSGVYLIPLITIDVVFSKAQTISWFWFVFRANHLIADVFILRAFGFNNKNITALRRKYKFFDRFFMRVTRWKSDASTSTNSISIHNLAVVNTSSPRSSISTNP